MTYTFSDLREILKQLWRRKTVVRGFFNATMHHVEVHGDVFDVGSGPNPYYHSYFKNAKQAVFHDMDPKLGHTINFEKDALPFPNNRFDVVLSMNVLEHIYNHNHLLREMVRVLKPKGDMVIFVPFFVIYHPDPGSSLDCFRYTKDALARMTVDAGLKEVRIEEVGMAMFTVSANMILSSLPRFVRPILFLPAYCIDALLLRYKKKYREQFPLGYMVYAKK
jgi:SAM-dependent methyltransferase